MAIQLTYHSNLYLSDTIKKKNVRRLKKKLEIFPALSGLYLITYAGNENDQLEIFKSKQLVQKYYKIYPPHIVGLAKNYEEAILLIQTITEECLQSTGNCFLKEFLKCQESY